MATNRLKSYFFQATSVLRPDGTTGGIRFVQTDKPNQTTFEDLLASTAFKKETGDRSKPYTGSSDLSTEQGLVVLATDVQAKAGTTQLTDRSLVTSPSQLPTVENLNASVFEDFPAQTMDIAADGATTTRNKFQVRIFATWLTKLYSRIIKQGGSSSYVPIKNSGTDYDWSWGDLSANATFVSNLIANNSFTTGLGNNTNLVSTLIANTTFTSGVANNANFISTLASNVTFINTLTSNSTFISDVQSHIITDKSITKNAGNNNAIELVNDQASLTKFNYYGTDTSITRGYNSIVETGIFNLSSGDIRITNISAGTLTVTTVNLGQLIYYRVGNILNMSYKFDIDFTATGAGVSATADLFFKMPVLASGQAVRLVEDIYQPINNDDPYSTTGMSLQDQILDTRAASGTTASETHGLALYNNSAGSKTLILNGQIWVRLNL